ncbi:MAG: hypothetical protein R2801_05010 [Chitinophagales bacterium]
MSKDKKKKDKKKKKKLKELRLQILDLKLSKNPKSKCCEKYLKAAHKRCKRCPMFDLLKKIKS